MIRALLLVTHLPLFRIILQGVVINQFRIILPLLSFDYLETWVDWEQQTVLEFDDVAIQ